MKVKAYPFFLSTQKFNSTPNMTQQYFNTSLFIYLITTILKIIML